MLVKCGVFSLMTKTRELRPCVFLVVAPRRRKPSSPWLPISYRRGIKKSRGESLGNGNYLMYHKKTRLFKSLLVLSDEETRNKKRKKRETCTLIRKPR